MNDERAEDTNAGGPSPGEQGIFPGGGGPDLPEPSPRLRPPLPRPLLIVALAYMAGLTLGRLALLPPLLPTLGAVAIVLPAVFTLLRHRGPGFPAPAHGLTLLIALGLLGWSASNAAVREEQRAARAAEPFKDARFMRLKGKVSRVTRLTETGLRLRLQDVAVQPAGGNSRARPLPMDVELVYFGGDEEAGAADPQPGITGAMRRLPGARVVVWARPPTLDSAAHPWDFDQADYYRHRGIGAGYHLPNLKLVEIREPPSTLRRWINRARVAGHEYVRTMLRERLGPDASSIAQAMVLGERSRLSSEVRTMFRNAGLTHLLVVSGLHTAFILAVALFLARLLGLPPGAWALCGLTALGIFTLWVGFRPPVVRASIMGAFLLGAWWLGRPASTLAGLAAAAFVTLLIDARNLTRPDWQLSYACVLSLTLLTRPLSELVRGVLGGEIKNDPGPIDRFKYFARRWVLTPSTAVLAILMGLLPFQAYYFGQINISSIVSNLIAIPLAYTTMLTTFVGVALHELPGLGAAASGMMDAPARGLLACARAFEEPAVGRLQLPALSPLLLLGYSVFLLAGPHLGRGRAALDHLDRFQLRHIALRVGAFFLLLAWGPVLARASTDDLLEIYCLDVGQGDAIVLRLPDGPVGVIDAGGGRQGGEGEKTVAPFLKGLGIGRLAFAAATHADADHIGGLDGVIEAIDVPLLLLGPHRAKTAAWEELMTAVAEHRVRIREVRAGDTLENTGEVAIRFLGPFAGQSGNDASLITLIDYGEVEILLTGDIERSAEYRLLEEGEVMDIDVLKVAHHGSATSTSEAFLRAFEPELALISVGGNNRFGHPSPNVVRRLERHGIAIGRTDVHGSLRLTTDGRRLRLDAFGSPPSG